MATKSASRNELVNHLIEALPDLGLTKDSAARILEVLPTILFGLAKSRGKVIVTGLGSFRVKHRPERLGRNPSTGGQMTIAASRKLTFSATKAAKASI